MRNGKEDDREMTGKELAGWMESQEREFILHVEWREQEYEPEPI